MSDTAKVTKMPLNLYRVKINGTMWLGFDSYDSFVICCETEEIARNTHPGSGLYKPEPGWETQGQISSWVKPDQTKDLDVTFLGVAAPGIERDLVVVSFNAG